MNFANTEAELEHCFPVIRELRPHLTLCDFLNRVQRQQAQGYQLVYVSRAGHCVAVAGFRIDENLAVGKYLYVDDFVVLAKKRSQGIGRGLLEWLLEYTQAQGCSYFQLDSGVQREDAHRFYEQTGLTITGLHFAKKLQ